LREEGLAPEWWITPAQQPGGSTAVEAETLTVVFLVCSSAAQLGVARAKARERLRGHGTIDWEDAAPATRNRPDKKI
jgi:hypothetical protein